MRTPERLRSSGEPILFLRNSKGGGLTLKRAVTVIK